MNGFQNGKNFNLDEPIPGCLGRMVNLFDLSTVARNKLLTDKPHYEGSSISRNQSDVARMTHSGNQIQDKVIMSELRRTSDKKLKGTPMKTLLDQEMSNEIKPVQNLPGVVAKLMGLDALPRDQTDITAQRSHSVAYSRSSDTPSRYCRDEGYLETELSTAFDQYSGQNEYKDSYDIWRHSRGTHFLRDKSPNKARYDETVNEKKMALVRQKFVEAKRLATDEKLRQSKQFQDALEILCANKDSFLKFLQEPNSLFSQNLFNMHSVASPPETKRITVLRPSKMVDSGKFHGKNDEKYTKRTGRINGFEKNRQSFSPRASSWKADEVYSQPTRIVVLKPTPGKSHDVRAMGSPPSISPENSRNEELFGELDHDVVRGSREVARSITQRMRETLGRHGRDDTFLSSMFSNGYTGDESSFNISETEHAAEILSDSEEMPPVSRHSWDYINRMDSPYSCSSFSRASYSPESSVCREAKKRLSERWAMLASNGSYQEPKHVRRNSSTLGEMLALSDMKGTGKFEKEDTNREQRRASGSSVTNGNLMKDEDINKSPQNLLRSKSVPSSSTQCSTSLNVASPKPNGPKPEVVAEDAMKTRNSKSSLKEKVSSLFFSRTKKPGKEISSTSQPKSEMKVSPHSHGCIDNGTERIDDSELKCSSPGVSSSSSQASCPRLNGKQSTVSSEDGIPARKSLAYGKTGENQDQPSPISVLEPPFERDEHTASESSYKADKPGVEVPDYPLRSNLIDKSPPIGSIARTLSWDDSCVDTATSYSLTTSSYTRGLAEEEQEEEEDEKEWFLYVQTLVSMSGLGDEVESNLFMARWYSPESPLDPSLRDNHIDVKDKEAKRSQRRSTRKLVFDCVNAVIIDIAGSGSDVYRRAAPRVGSCNDRLLVDNASCKMADKVWAQMKEWFSGETRCDSGWDDDEHDNSLVVERAVRNEVAGKGWDQHFRLEMDILRDEIERKLLEELVQESLLELTHQR